MPISYSIDHARGFITEIWTGDVDAPTLAAYWRHYLADPSVLALRRTVVDLRQCRIQFTGAELAAAMNVAMDSLLKDLDWKTAIVIDDPVQFGVARQYQVFADRYSRDSIFSDPETAVAWLLA